MAFIGITNDKIVEEKKLALLQYDFTKEEREVLVNVMRDYNHAYSIKHQTFREFNDLSVLNRQIEDQKTFNAYIPPKKLDEDNYWKAQTKRPTTRNKVIFIAAKITASILAPHIFAQNEDDEEDKDAGKVMETIMQWVNENSNYETIFLNAVIAMLVNPCAYVYVDYTDDEECGFVDYNVPVDEILLANNYIQDIQKQPFIIRDRKIDFVTAKEKWGKEENFQYVKPGIQLVFNGQNEQFYQEYDPSAEDRLVSEVIYWNKNENLEIVYLNGIPIKQGELPKKRKYPIVKSGYELIDEGQFTYYKSLVFKLAPEQRVLDEIYNLVLDGSFLSIMPSAAIFGEEIIDSNVVAPGSITTFTDPNTRMEVFTPKGDLSVGYNLINTIENSMTEASQSAASGAGLPNRTAYEVATLEENARVQLGLFGKMIAKFVKDWGELKLCDIVKHLTVGQVQELNTGSPLKYKTLLLNDENSDKTTKVEFRSDLPEEPITEEEELIMQLELLSEEKKKNQTIYKVNPALFRKLKYKIKVSPDTLFKPTGGILRAFNLEGYDRMINNPLIASDMNSLANVTRDMLVANYKPNSVDKYVPDPKVIQKQQQAKAQAEQAQAQQAESGMTESLGKVLGTQEQAVQGEKIFDMPKI